MLNQKDPAPNPPTKPPLPVAAAGQSAPDRLAQLQLEVQSLRQQVQWYELQLREMRGQLFGPKSEHRPTPAPVDPGQQLMSWAQAEKDQPAPTPAAIAEEKVQEAAASKPPARAGATQPKGPRPFPANLPRKVIEVADPDLNERICPVTGKVMQLGFFEEVEALARQPGYYYVRVYRRRVFVSPAKCAPVAADWPGEVLPRSRVHASVVGHVAAEHYGMHLPFHRIEAQLALQGAHLPRSTQVALMQRLDRVVAPLIEELRRQVLGSGYVHADATPVPLLDPKRPGATREATLWAYRTDSDLVWFDFRLSKSPDHPRQVLREYAGLLQTDGAPGLETLGVPGKVTHLGCWAHLRRYFVKALDAGEPEVRAWLDPIERIFRLERHARERNQPPVRRQRARERYSLPAFERLLARARAQIHTFLPKTRLGQALVYLLNQAESLRRCLTIARARIDNNPVENAIRPLKLGAANWLFIGHPDAGPRLANLFTLVQNCRLAKVDPESYLIDLVARFQDYPMARIADFLPHRWSPPTPVQTPAPETLQV